MSEKVRPIPQGFTTMTPHLIVKDAPRAIEFYAKAFEAKELFRIQPMPQGPIVHARLMIGNSIVMLADEMPDWGSFGPDENRASPVVTHLYVDDVDQVFAQAVDAGAQVTMPLADVFWGDRYGTLKDPFGHSWSVATHIEDLDPDQLQQKAIEAFSQGGDS